VAGLTHCSYTLRSMKVSTHKGQVSFPGGVRDAGKLVFVALFVSVAAYSLVGESLAACCLRECREEVGIELTLSDLMGQLPSGRSLSGMKVTPFVAFLGDIDPTRLQLSTDEISEAFCVAVDDLLDDGKVEMQDFSGKWSVPRYNGGAHPVWGLTAYITQYFLAQVSSFCALWHGCTRRLWPQCSFNSHAHRSGATAGRWPDCFGNCRL
jgi:nudix motif 8